MFHKDGFFLGRIVNGSMSNERARHDLPGLSPIFQPVAARLLAALPQERQPIWDDFLAGHLRPDPISEAVSAPPEPPAVATPEESVATAEVTTPPGPPQPLSTTRAERADEPERRVRLTCAVNLSPREVEWLWSGRVPLGMITMFAGDPKLGKSYVTLAMAAAVSRGLPLPVGDRPNCPGSTILMSAEDDLGRTIVPRLIAAGADLAKVYILESVILANGSETLPSLRADVDAIMAAAARLGDCRLIVIDPVSAYLTGVDDNRNAVLRGVLTPLKVLAERLGAAVVLVSHLTKAGSANSKHRVLGSIAYVGACRANYLFVADPRDPTGRRVLMLDTGGNVAPPAPTLDYVIEECGSGPRVVWSDEPVPITIGEALRPRQEITEGKVVDAQECNQWPGGLLKEGPKPSIEVFKAAIDAGYTRDQVKDAKHCLGVVAQKHGFQEGARWTWQLRTASTS
jgi:putative DNA primase/helicase